MTKLRMIVTYIIVLAIVGGAFSYKTKGGTFCGNHSVLDMAKAIAMKLTFALVL